MITAGIDIGSLTTKALISEDGVVLSHKTVFTGDSSKNAALHAIDEAVKLAEISIKDIGHFAYTGVGKNEMPYDGESVTELICDVKGVLSVKASTKTIIDMGAESCRIIRCNAKGRVIDFVLNDKCASGTGVFLDAISKALEINIEEIGPLSIKAKEEIYITSTCSVFAESEVVGLIAQGKEKASILGGIHRSIANRVYGLVNRIGVKEDIAFIGGGALNAGIQVHLEALIKQKMFIPDNPQTIGALGAALVAQERSSR